MRASQLAARLLEPTSTVGTCPHQLVGSGPSAGRGRVQLKRGRRIRSFELLHSRGKVRGSRGSGRDSTDRHREPAQRLGDPVIGSDTRSSAKLPVGGRSRRGCRLRCDLMPTLSEPGRCGALLRPVVQPVGVEVCAVCQTSVSASGSIATRAKRRGFDRGPKSSPASTGSKSTAGLDPPSR